VAWNAVSCAGYEVQVDNSSSFNTMLAFAWAETDTQVVTDTWWAVLLPLRTVNSYGAAEPERRSLVHRRYHRTVAFARRSKVGFRATADRA
jgi:hypothetical protein